MDMQSRIVGALIVFGFLFSLRALARAAPGALKYGLENRSQVEGALGMLKRLFKK